MSRSEPIARGVTGVAVTRDGQLGLAFGDQTLLLVLEPGEMRELASQLTAAAADLEARAVALVDAAIARAGGLQ